MVTWLTMQWSLPASIFAAAVLMVYMVAFPKIYHDKKAPRAVSEMNPGLDFTYRAIKVVLKGVGNGIFITNLFIATLQWWNLGMLYLFHQGDAVLHVMPTALMILLMVPIAGWFLRDISLYKFIVLPVATIPVIAFMAVLDRTMVYKDDVWVVFEFFIVLVSVLAITITALAILRRDVPSGIEQLGKSFGGRGGCFLQKSAGVIPGPVRTFFTKTGEVLNKPAIDLSRVYKILYHPGWIALFVCIGLIEVLLQWEGGTIFMIPAGLFSWTT